MFIYNIFISETCFIFKLVWFIALTTPIRKLLQNILALMMTTSNFQPKCIYGPSRNIFIRSTLLFILNSFSSSLVFISNHSIYLCRAILSHLSSFYYIKQDKTFLTYFIWLAVLWEPHCIHLRIALAIWWTCHVILNNNPATSHYFSSLPNV